MNKKRKRNITSGLKKKEKLIERKWAFITN